ncbi:hypothetical protein ABH923_002506 [Leifsonia sp. EB41]|uniref:hypothetical protein n=1 Tax=Leifsonia sp. EB41 TaxID=3156260 RepID=UPI0035179C6B
MSTKRGLRWMAQWRGAPAAIKGSVGVLIATSAVMLVFGVLDVASGAARPLSNSTVAQMTQSGRDAGADFGVALIFIIFSLGIMLLSILPAALGALILNGASAARIVLIVLGLFLLALGASASDSPLAIVAVLLLVAVALSFFRSSRAYLSNKSSPLN